MKPMKRVSKPRQLDNMVKWHEKEEERRREVKKKLKTAAAKKRPRPTGARGGSKSEPPKKKRKVDNDDSGSDDGGSHESTPRAHSDGKAKRTETGNRVPTRGKDAAKGKKLQVKVETPAVPSGEETPVAPPTVNESTANSKRKKPQQRETQTEPVPIEKEAFKRSIPIEQYSTRADKGTQTSAKINVTVLLVELATKMDLAREQWLPAAKQHFLTSLGDVGKAHLFLDLSNVDVYDLERYGFDDGTMENPNLVDIHVKAIEEQVEQLKEEHPQSKVVLVGWGSSCLATLGAVPTVADKLACVINIAFYESEIAKFYAEPKSLSKVSNCKVPILFVVGAGGEGGQIAVNAVEDLRTRLSVPTGTIAVERVSEELLVPVHMLRSATSSQGLVQERIISNVADFIKETLDEQKKKKAQSSSAGKKKRGGK